MKKVVITAAVRTPIGTFGKAFKNVSAVDLGTTAIREALKRSEITPDLVDEVYFGTVIQAGLGQNVARQCAIQAGIPHEKTAMTINMVCGSGLRTVALATQAIMLGDAEVVVVGGTENMTQAPYSVAGMRWGSKMGTASMYDELVDGALTDVFNKYHMGVTAENLAKKFNLSREQQDQHAYNSQMKAARAQEDGKFNEEIVPVEVRSRKSVEVVDQDEYLNPTTTMEKLGKLRAAFDRDGTVTAGNASGINDGAAALVLMSEEKAIELKLPIFAEIVDYASAGVDPALMGYGPVPAIKKNLSRAKMNIDEIDLFELNEAFSAQSLSVLEGIKNEIGAFDVNKVNVNGGAIALGHPVGASGARILVTLLHEMRRQDAKTGLASLCIGGGMGTSLIVRRS